MSRTVMDTTPPSPPGPAAPDPAPAPPPLPLFPAPPRAPRNRLLAVFVGPDGVHAAVRWLLYLFMGAVTLFALGALAHAIRPRQTPVWWGMVSQVVVVAAAILPAYVMALIEGRPFSAFGLPWRNAFRRNFWLGALWGMAWLTVLMLALRLAGAFSFGSLALHGASIVKYGIYYVVYFVFTGFFEEFTTRGYSQWVLTRAVNFWPAAASLSFLFGLAHSGNSGESKVGLLAAGLIGFFFCLTLRRTGDLWWAIGFHMSWDWGESYLYSVPDSGGMMRGHLLYSSFRGPDWLTGGTVGPEGSLLVFAVIVAMWVLFDRRYPDVKWKGDGNC